MGDLIDSLRENASSLLDLYLLLISGSFKELGDMIGPLLMGTLSQVLGLKWGFVICAVLGGMALLISIIAASKNKKII